MGDAAATAPSATASWDSQLDLAMEPLTEDNVLDLDCVKDEDIASDFLISEEDDEVDIFVTPARAA